VDGAKRHIRRHTGRNVRVPAAIPRQAQAALSHCRASALADPAERRFGSG